MNNVSAVLFRCIVIVLASAVISGFSLGCSEQPSDSPDVTDSDELLEALTSARLTDNERENLTRQLLEQCTFYQGRVTIYEDQKWTSRGTDGSSGYGDSTLSTDEILVYHPETQKTYIISRYMSCSGWHRITVNDMHGNFLQSADVVHSGDLYEYYGTGFIWQKNPENTIASEHLIEKYTLNFAANPVRMNNDTGSFYTYPLPRQIDWVTFTSIAGTERRGGIRMFPPDESKKNTDVTTVPLVSAISDTNTYNSSETWVYEATDRIWTPSGRVSYDYYKISYSDAMSEIERLEAEASVSGSFSEIAQNQPPAWQEAAATADELGSIASTIDGLNDISTLVLPQDIRDAVEAMNAAEALANEKIIRDLVDNAGPASASASTENDVESAATRSLEGVIIESSSEDGAGIQQKNIKDSFTDVKPYLTELYRDYASVSQKMQNILAQVREDYSDGALSVDTISGLLDEFREQVQYAVKLNETTETILADAWVVLYGLNDMGDVDPETRYGELNRLFSVWKDTFEIAANTDIDIMQGVETPAGYPDNIVPIIDGAFIAISECIPGEDGAPDGYALTLKTNTATDEAATWYTNLLKNEQDFSSFSYSGMATLSGVKNGYEFSVMVMANTLGGSEKTVIQISLTPYE
jgi:hypothetical protein